MYDLFTKLREGNVFTSVCQEFCPRAGGRACQAPRHAHPLPCKSPAIHAPSSIIHALHHARSPAIHAPPAPHPPGCYEMRSMSGRYASYWNAFLLPSATKLQRLCFYRRLSVHRGGGVPDPHGTRYTPRDQVHPPGTRYTPLRPGTPPGTRYTPQDQEHPPGPGPPLDQVHPRDQVSPPEIRPLLRTVRILLECILVTCIFMATSLPSNNVAL